MQTKGHKFAEPKWCASEGIKGNGCRDTECVVYNLPEFPEFWIVPGSGSPKKLSQYSRKKQKGKQEASCNFSHWENA